MMQQPPTSCRTREPATLTNRVPSLLGPRGGIEGLVTSTRDGPPQRPGPLGGRQEST